jgi:hypothetical protein
MLLVLCQINVLYTTGEIDNSAYSMNGWLMLENSVSIPRHSKVVVTHDHMEPRIENGNDMLYANSNCINIDHYITSNDTSCDRSIFMHYIESNKHDETDRKLNCLWLYSHITASMKPLEKIYPRDV